MFNPGYCQILFKKKVFWLLVYLKKVYIYIYFLSLSVSMRPVSFSHIFTSLYLLSYLHITLTQNRTVLWTASINFALICRTSFDDSNLWHLKSGTLIIYWPHEARNLNYFIKQRVKLAEKVPKERKYGQKFCAWARSCSDVSQLRAQIFDNICGIFRYLHIFFMEIFDKLLDVRFVYVCMYV